MNRKLPFFTIAFVLGLVIDQATKLWISANLDLYRDEIVIIPELLSLVHAQNTGAAFSMMEGQRALFLVLGIVAIGVIGWMYRGLAAQSRFLPVTLGLILSGAVGNWVDRARLGYVVDMVKCWWGFEPGATWLKANLGTNVYPIWNVADSALLIGVFLFVLNFVFESEGETPEEKTGDDVPDLAEEAGVATDGLP